MGAEHGSRIPAFRRLSIDARREELVRRGSLKREDIAVLDSGGLPAVRAERLVENVVGVYALPFGLALNFLINGQDYVVPMVVEEPSVIAAASNGARIVRDGGGFHAEADDALMTAQLEVCGVMNVQAARDRILERTDELLHLANAAVPRLKERGGGARSVAVRAIKRDDGTSERLVVHIDIDCRDAMGANMANTVAEALADHVARLAGGRSGLRILTNLADHRCVRAFARIPAASLATDGLGGLEVCDRIAAASHFAEDDPYRAATHNKGIMNGVDAVVLATGNDWRGVEAGAHAFAAIKGSYRPLATWAVDDGALLGRLEMPMAVGTVGGTLQAHEGALLAQRILGVTSAKTLSMIIGCVGLASNLAALRALTTEGIQRGHMALQAGATALARGALAPNPSSPDPAVPQARSDQRVKS